MMKPLVPNVEQLDAHCWRMLNKGFSMNTGLIVGEDLAAVIDTGSGPREAAGLYAAIRRITDLPLLVINTHAHGDHVFGNNYFAAHGVEDFHASAAAVEHLRGHGNEERQLVRFLEPEMAMRQGPYSSIVVPTKIIAETGTTLELGGRTLEVFGMGRGHTAGDLLVRCGRILFTGDLVEEGGPPNFEDADPFLWAELLDRLERQCEQDTVIVPGHGNVVDLDFVRRQHREMLAALREGKEIVASWPAGSFDPTAYQLELLPYGPEQSTIFLQRLRELLP
ncbi:MBL fold metallo-hydrolase [Paeniglutamicibacter sp.]|uniref:MBL fold metallo-hydrolase n=1 Tax=Paeniglutamicibacter sp. TaxID=1934391 RepID=UPI00398975C1